MNSIYFLHENSRRGWFIIYIRLCSRHDVLLLITRWQFESGVGRDLHNTVNATLTTCITQLFFSVRALMGVSCTFVHAKESLFHPRFTNWWAPGIAYDCSSLIFPSKTVTATRPVRGTTYYTAITTGKLKMLLLCLHLFIDNPIWHHQRKRKEQPLLRAWRIWSILQPT